MSTGTDGGLTPGSAECDIYRLVDDPDTGERVLDSCGFTRIVYNFSASDIPGDWWVLIKRDKFGDWYAESGSGSSGTSRRVLVVRTPESGIPALDEHTTGTGTEFEDDEPGYADCDAYELDDSGTGTDGPSLVSLDEVVTVYNISTADIPGDTWIVAVEEEAGYFVGVLPAYSPTADAGDADCRSIPGIDFDELPITGNSTGTGDDARPDYALGLRDGCLVRIPIGECE